MTQIVIARNLHSVPMTELTKRDIGLVTLDLDKVLTEHHAHHIYPEAHNFVDELRNQHMTPVLATNSTDKQRLSVIGAKLDGIPVLHRGQDGQRGKPYPDMLIAAKKQHPGVRAAHIDDQLKAYIAARGAKYDLFIYVWPRGNFFRDHPGTYVLRLIEFPIVCVLGLMQALRRK